MVANAVVFFQPNRIKAHFFAVDRFFQRFLEITTTFSRDDAEFHV